MQIVIDISENIYNLIVGGEENRDFVYKSDLMRAILEGTPLPEDHGRIIDESKISKCEKVGLIIKDNGVTRCMSTDAPTIIGAAKRRTK